MTVSSPYLRWFNDLRMKDVPLVGGKNASLGELYERPLRVEIAMNDNEATVAERVAFLEIAAEKMRQEADEAEAQLLLTPADEHLHKRLIALRKLADEAEDAVDRLRSENTKT